MSRRHILPVGEAARDNRRFQMRLFLSIDFREIEMNGALFLFKTR